MKALFGYTLLFLLIAAILLGAFIAWNVLENRTFEETFYTLETEKVNKPVRVAVISDLHQLSFGKDNELLLRRLSLLKPDIIAVAGDLVNRKNTDAGFALNICKKLVEIAPVYYGMGNHENCYLYGDDLGKQFLKAKLPDQMNGHSDFSGLERNTFLQDLSELGVQVVHNSKVLAEVNGQTIEIGGISTDESSFWDFSGKFIYNWAEDGSGSFKLLICHRPNVVMKYIPDYPFDLVLSGHLHGGGVRIPGVGGVYGADMGFFPDYTGGLYRSGSLTMIVSRGFAGKDFIPRILNKPELVIVDITPDR